jgi:DNA-binding MarR family transcriptional regulator
MKETLLPALTMLACFHRRLFTEANRFSGTKAFSGKKEVGYQRYIILHCLNLSPEWSLKNLAKLLGVSTPSLSLVVDSLSREGLVIRKMNPTDRRQVLLALTSAGKALLEGIEGRMVDRLEKQAGRLKKDEQLKLTEICRELATGYLPRFFSII